MPCHAASIKHKTSLTAFLQRHWAITGRLEGPKLNTLTPTPSTLNPKSSPAHAPPIGFWLLTSAVLGSHLTGTSNCLPSHAADPATITRSSGYSEGLSSPLANCLWLNYLVFARALKQHADACSMGLFSSPPHVNFSKKIQLWRQPLKLHIKHKPYNRGVTEGTFPGLN